MEPAAQGVSGFFLWQVPGQPVTVQLSVDLVDRMGAEIMRGFGAVPKRGAEVGGILIGTRQPGDVSTVRIEDFEAIPCSYSRGPSYLLTDAERELFAEVCQRRRSEIVGYYRSHTRDGLALQPEDIQLLDRYFAAGTQVALLVKPFATKPGVAGFFIRDNSGQNGSFPTVTPLEFPFRRWELTGQEPPRRAPMQERRPPMQERKRKERQTKAGALTSAEATPEGTPAPYYRIFSMEPEKPPAQTPDSGPTKQKSRTGIWMVAAFVFLLLGVLLGYEASRITGPQRGASDFALSLMVERTGENLTVRWNPASRAIVLAGNGVLEIDDGGETKRVELDRANLASGRMVYRNVSDMVRFRLVVSLDSGLTLTETLGWSH